MRYELTGAESLNLFLQENIPEFAGKIQVCICQKKRHFAVDEDEKAIRKWECLSGKSESREALEKLLQVRAEQTVGLERCFLEETGEYILYAAWKDGVADSRLEGNGAPKDIWWIFLGEKPNEAARILCKVLSDELMDKFEDMLLLDSMLFLGKKDAGNRRKGSIHEENQKQYFLGNVLDRDWFLRKYVNWTLQEYGLPEWRLFVQISALFYEKRTIKTKIYFADQDWKFSPDKGIVFDGKDGVEPEYYLKDNCFRTIRKMMELSGEEHGLLVQKEGRRIKGVIKADTDAPSVYVEFQDHLVWQLVVGEEALFKYRKGDYLLPSLEEEDNLEKQMESLDKLSMEKTAIENVKKIIRQIKENAPHGSAIVFMDGEEAREEAKRLHKHNKAYLLKKDTALLEHISEIKGMAAIDGAILAGTDGMCYAVGAILDGASVLPGDAGRGARYNSVTNYTYLKWDNNKNGIYFAVVMSEDKMVNVYIPSQQDQ